MDAIEEAMDEMEWLGGEIDLNLFEGMRTTDRIDASTVEAIIDVFTQNIIPILRSPPSVTGFAANWAFRRDLSPLSF